MQVLIADKFDDAGMAELRAAGCEITFEPKLVDDALRDAIARIGPQVLVVRGTKVTAAMLEACDTLALVVRAGAGVNTIDLSAASRRSILVANCPGKNAVAVAELTFALILALDRRIVESVCDLRNGMWNKAEYDKARGLKGRTLGIIGMGQIGQAVARRAIPFGMPIVAWSRSLTDERAEEMGVKRCASPAEVASRCDILTVHVAASKETKNLVSADVLGRLKPGSFVINTARADVMDYEALGRLVAEKDLRVGVDVFPVEPSGGTGAFSDAIVKAGGIVYGTHHIGASTEQAQAAISKETVGIVTEYLRTGKVRNCVNIRGVSPAPYVVVVRHRNCPGVLAHVLNAISRAGVNVEEMENMLCDGAESACAQIKLSGPLSDDVLHAIETGHEHVFGVSHTSIGRP